MDQSIFGAIALSNNQNITNNNFYVDQCNDPNLVIARYRSSYYLFAGFVTDFFYSIDFGFHVILISNNEKIMWKEFNEWRVENRLPMYRQNKVVSLKDGTKSDYSAIILQGKKLGKIAKDEQEYKQKVELALQGFGISKYKFYPCSFDAVNQTNPLIKEGQKSLKIDLKKTKEFNTSLQRSLKQCILDLIDSDQLTDPSMLVNKTIQSIILEKMQVELAQLGYWEIITKIDCSKPSIELNKSFITNTSNQRNDIFHEIYNLHDFSEQSISGSSKSKDLLNTLECRSAMILKNFFEQGFYFRPNLFNREGDANIRSYSIYEELLKSEKLRKILDFEPCTLADINPITFWHLDLYDYSNNFEPWINDRNLDHYLHAKLLNIANYVSDNSFTSKDDDLIFQKFQNHHFNAFFRINLEGNYIDLEQINLDALEKSQEDDHTMNNQILELVYALRKLKPQINHETSELIHKLSYDQNDLDRQVELNWEADELNIKSSKSYLLLPIWFHRYADTLPNLRFLHHYFFIAHKLATILKAKSFMFGYDQPFNDQWICANYTKVSDPNSSQNDLIKNGILFHGVNAKIGAVGYLRFGSVKDLNNCYNQVEICDPYPML